MPKSSGRLLGKITINGKTVAVHRGSGLFEVRRKNSGGMVEVLTPKTGKGEWASRASREKITSVQRSFEKARRGKNLFGLDYAK
jgi:hypothetical protein